jgi:hypothetical protein
VQVGEGVDVGRAVVGSGVGVRGAGGDAGALAGRVLVAWPDADALALAECETDPDAAAVGRRRWVALATGEATALGAALSVTGEAGPDCSAAVGVPVESANTPRPPTVSTPAVTSTSAPRRRDRPRRRLRRSTLREPGDGSPCAGSTAVGSDAAAVTGNSWAGRPHPAQDRAPLRWRLQVGQ